MTTAQWMEIPILLVAHKPRVTHSTENQNCGASSTCQKRRFESLCLFQGWELQPLQVPWMCCARWDDLSCDPSSFPKSKAC